MRLGVLRFGKTVDWTSRKTAIGRISLDDKIYISYACSCGCNTLEQYFCSWGLKIHYKPSTLTEVYCESFFSTVVQGRSL